MNVFAADVKNVTDLYSEIFCNQVLHEFQFLDLHGNPIHDIVDPADVSNLEFRLDADSSAYRISFENLGFENFDFTDGVCAISINPIVSKCEVSCFAKTDSQSTDFTVIKKCMLLLSLKRKPGYSMLLVTHQKCVTRSCGQTKHCVRFKGQDKDDHL